MAPQLHDYRGILQSDGYAGYRKLAGDLRANGLRLAERWAISFESDRLFKICEDMMLRS